MPTTLHIRRATSVDIPLIMALERDAGTAAHWTELQYRRLFADDHAARSRLALVAEPAPDVASRGNPSLLGFLVASQVAAEWELENIVVAATARRNGLGKRLMEALLAEASETNSHSVFLEVRESNVGARNLYEKAGFQLTGRRKSYYASPLEDALLYRLDFR
jgi:[ribosomal protein S18]-alanine N-acetyltransferase